MIHKAAATRRALRVRAPSLPLEVRRGRGRGGGVFRREDNLLGIFSNLHLFFVPRCSPLQSARHLVLFFFLFFSPRCYEFVCWVAFVSLISSLLLLFSAVPRDPSATPPQRLQKPKRFQNASQNTSKTPPKRANDASALLTDDAAKEGGGGPAGRAQGGGAKQEDRPRR